MKESKELRKRIESELKEQETFRYKYFNPGETKPVETQTAGPAVPAPTRMIYQPTVQAPKQVLPQPGRFCCSSFSNLSSSSNVFISSTSTESTDGRSYSNFSRRVTATTAKASKGCRFELLLRRKFTCEGWKEEFVTQRAIEEAMEALFL